MFRIIYIYICMCNLSLSVTLCNYLIQYDLWYNLILSVTVFSECTLHGVSLSLSLSLSVSHHFFPILGFSLILSLYLSQPLSFLSLFLSFPLCHIISLTLSILLHLYINTYPLFWCCNFFTSCFLNILVFSVCISSLMS